MQTVAVVHKVRRQMRKDLDEIAVEFFHSWAHGIMRRLGGRRHVQRQHQGELILMPDMAVGFELRTVAV